MPLLVSITVNFTTTVLHYNILHMCSNVQMSTNAQMCTDCTQLCSFLPWSVCQGQSVLFCNALIHCTGALHCWCTDALFWSLNQYVLLLHKDPKDKAWQSATNIQIPKKIMKQMKIQFQNQNTNTGRKQILIHRGLVAVMEALASGVLILGRL